MIHRAKGPDLDWFEAGWSAFHAHVMRDIRAMVKHLETDSNVSWHCVSETYADAQGKRREPALRALADESERRQQLETELEASRPKIASHDQVVSAETMIDFPQAFSLLKRRTGQTFTRRTFLEFLRHPAVPEEEPMCRGLTPNTRFPVQ